MYYMSTTEFNEDSLQVLLGQLRAFKHTKVFFGFAGCSPMAVTQLMEHGDVSKFFIGANVSYDNKLIDIFKVEGKCVSDKTVARFSEKTSRVLESEFLDNETKNIITVCTTASLAGVNQRTGRINQAFVAVNDLYVRKIAHLVFDSTHTRAQQERILSAHILSLLSKFIEEEQSANDEHQLRLPYKWDQLWYDL